MCLAQGPQRSDAGEARTRGPSVSSQALYHWTPYTSRENPAQFENQIKPRMYVRRITRSTMYEVAHFVSRNWRKEN